MYFGKEDGTTRSNLQMGKQIELQVFVVFTSIKSNVCRSRKTGESEGCVDFVHWFACTGHASVVQAEDLDCQEN